MKHLLLALSFFTLAACMNEKLDMAAATKTAESAIQLIGDEKFDDLSQLYTKDFSNSEAKEEREKKFDQIIKVTGKTIAYNLTDSIIENNTGEESRLILKYKVKHANTSTTETYTVVKEEGKYLLSNIYITNTTPQ